MGCIYENYEGECTMYDKDSNSSDNFENSPYGWNFDGGCVCSDDPNPYNSCELFESDDPEFEPEEF
jgi:hypothetical protein